MGILRAVGFLAVGLILWAIIFGLPQSIYTSVLGSYYSNPTSEAWIIWSLKAVPIITFLSLVYYFWINLQPDNQVGFNA